MTIQDLTNNRERIIKKVKFQITLATQENIKGVMSKMIAFLPQYEGQKPLMKNIDKLTMRAIESYIKHEKVNTDAQNAAIDANIEMKKMESMPSSLRY